MILTPAQEQLLNEGRCHICGEPKDDMAFCPNWQRDDHNVPPTPEELEAIYAAEDAALLEAETPREPWTDEGRYL